MDPDKASAAKGFTRDLRQLRQRAGDPSYSTLERVSGHQLKRATVSDILNGNRVKPPEWRFVALFVEACHAAAKENKLDLHELGSVADWKWHWDGAVNGVLDARFPGGGHQLAGVAVPDQGQASEQVVGRAGPEDAEKPAAWGAVPPRLTDFVGRESQMADLSRKLAAGAGASPVAILGLCGIGKTQLAVEYAYRHAAKYDLVWWVPCDDVESAHNAMADLRSRLGLPELGLPEVVKDEDDTGHGETGQGGLFDLLQKGEPQARWLLIFDNADKPEAIRHLVPPVGGHVLVTSRNSSWEASGTVLELDVFTREESVEFLRRGMPRYNQAEAYRIAEMVGDLPLLLEHAVESRAAIDEYLARLQADPLGLLDSQPSDYPATVAQQWRDSLAQLPTDAMDLLNCLCFLGGASIPREAIERGGYFPTASIHHLLRDPMLRNRAIRMLRRAGLLRLGADARTLTVHRLTRYIVRDKVANAGADATERARHDSHLLLAAADPRDPDDPVNWRSYEQLHEHATEADAEACSDEAVRRLVVNLVRFQNAAGDPHGALRLADGALRRWTPDGPPATNAEPAGGFDGHLAMRGAKVNALFACGRHQEAFRFQQETLALMRATPGDWGDEITLLGRVTGARCRMLGRFPDGLAADEQSRAEHVARFGPDDPRSFAAASDVIVSLTLTGQFAEAVREARRVYADCLAFYSDPGYPAVLFQRNMLARCLWLHGRQYGRYDEAMAVMADVDVGYRALAAGGILDENHPWHLTHEVDYVLLRRDSLLAQQGGTLSPDLDMLVAHLHGARRRCWRALTADHPQTLAATVALGSVLRRNPGRISEAIRVLAEAERRYQSALPDHPFTLACTEYLAMVRGQAATGDPGPEPDFTPLPL
jgi:hypothetical protein